MRAKLLRRINPTDFPSFSVRLCKYIHKGGKLRFIKDAESRIEIVLLSNGKWSKISEQEFKIYCNTLLKKILNQRVHNLLPIHKEDGDKETEGEAYVELEDIEDVGRKIIIDADSLHEAKRNHFSLSKERKQLIEELKLTKEMYEPEENFLPPKNIIPFKNGFLDFEDGKFHDYGDNGNNGFLYQLNANYRPEYEKGYLPQELKDLIWNAVASQNYSQEVNEERMRSFLECIAYSFLPTNPLRKLFLIIGPTACGKSTLVAIIRAIFGDLGLHLQSYSIMRQSRYDHELRPDLKAAMDMLWLDISETDNKQEIDSVTVKTFTGNDPITFRKPHSDKRVTKTMNCKIWIITNKFPKIINYNDMALQDRLTIFDWSNTIQPENRNNNLVELLTTDENRDRIATCFAHWAKGIYKKTALSIHHSFEFNTKKYFLNQGDLVAQFYDCLPKSQTDCTVNPYTCVSTWDLGGLYYGFLKNMNDGYDFLFMDAERRAFENRFAEIAKSDRFHMVRRQKFTNGHFYIGILIPMQERHWLFSIPANTGFAPTPSMPPQIPAPIYSSTDDIDFTDSIFT
jgi:hypothetical protein